MYGELFENYSTLLKAMAHPRRLEIIHLLRKEELSVAQIYKMLDLPQANISQHLMILRSAGVLKDKRSGKQIYYRLAHPNIIQAGDLLRQVLIDTRVVRKDPDSTLVPEEFIKFVPLVHDPVCGMRLAPQTADFSWVYQKQRYYFCASGCLKQFKKNPDQYLAVG